jgi:hypothetical protein
MYQYFGKCSCGEVAIQFSSPQEISSYKSRSCDCDYCLQREIEYLSGSQGQITFISKRPFCFALIVITLWVFVILTKTYV